MYHPLTKLFHWTIGILIIGLLVVGFSFEYMDDSVRGITRDVHKSLGVIVLGLTALRVLWWLTQTKPALVKTIPVWLKPYINSGHNILYAFMVVMPLSGWLMSNAAGYPVKMFGVVMPTLVEKDMALRSTMSEVHEVGGWVLVALLVAHIGAAIYHHRVLKDDTLTRMLPRR